MLPAVFALVVSQSPDINVNHKYIMISYAFAAVLWGGILRSIFFEFRKKRIKWAGAAVCIIMSICLPATGVYDYVIILRDNDSGHRMTVNMESRLTDWLSENLGNNDLLLTPEYTMNEVTMSGVMMYCGWPYYAWSAGYDTYYRAAQAVSIYTTFDSELLKKMGLLFVLAVISYLISIMIGHFLLQEREGYDLSIEKFAVTYDNCGIIGVPLGYALYGNIGEIYANVFVDVFHIFCWTHGIMLLDKSGFQLKKLINPCLIAVIAGMVFFIFQIRLPESIDFAMSAIGDMNTPLAMLLSGAIMTQLNFKEVLTKRRLFFVAILRLIVSAGLFCLLLRFLPIDDQMRTVAAVTAACPAGAMTITMAIMYERDDHYATELFTVTTLLSILTMPLCMLIAG